jgi:hypothetical protein
MSVETRLRQARPEDDGSWPVGLQATYGAVVRQAGRRRAARRAVVGGAVAATLVVGGFAAVRSTGGDPTPAPHPPVTSQTPTTGTDTPGPSAYSPLEGVWRTPLVSRTEVEERLLAEGIAPRVADDYARGLPRGRFQIQLILHDGQFTAHMGERGPQMALFYRVSDDELLLRPRLSGFGRWRFGWTLDAAELTLDLRGATVIDYDGFTSRVHGLAMFGVAPFTLTH